MDNTDPTDSLDDMNAGSIPDSWRDPKFLIGKMLDVLTTDKYLLKHENSKGFREDTIAELQILLENPEDINQRRIVKRRLEAMDGMLLREKRYDRGDINMVYESVHLVLEVFWDHFPDSR